MKRETCLQAVAGSGIHLEDDTLKGARNPSFSRVRAMSNVIGCALLACVAAQTFSADCDGRQPLRILIVHEQHLQPMGCDERLLGIIRGLLALGLEVSLFFRSHTPIAKRSPSSSEMATLLRIPRGYREEWLREDVRKLPPPAMYEHSGSAQLARLFSQGWFNAVLVFFWFWHDPKPNVGELVLPALHAFSPRGHRPFVAVLSDDAHAQRDAWLASWESHPGLSSNYSARATQHAHREATAYALSDLLLHITSADSMAERAAFPFVARFGVLRFALSERSSGVNSSGGSSSGGSSDSADNGSSSSGSGGGSTVGAPVASASVSLGMPRVGFLGNGFTPTNHLAVQWFLNECWPALRARFPALRLRIVGQRPGYRVSVDGQERACDKARELHCGWAWATRYMGAEAANGIDELGFVSQAVLDAELASWAAMVVPVLRTTGINTKVYEALRLGLPLVITSAAISPFEVEATPNGSTAIIADDVHSFTAAVETLLTSATARARYAAGARERWAHMVQANHATKDLLQLVRMLCREMTREGFVGTAKLSAAPLAFGGGAPAVLADVAGSSRSGGGGSGVGVGSAGGSAYEELRCFVGGGALKDGSAADSVPSTTRGSATGRATGRERGLLPLLIGMHTTSAANATLANHLVGGAWKAVCAVCGLRCAFPLAPTSGAATPVAVIPAGTELAVLHLSSQQVPDLDGISLEHEPAVVGSTAATRVRPREHANGIAAAAQSAPAESAAASTAHSVVSNAQLVPVTKVGRFVHVVVDFEHKLGGALGFGPDANATRFPLVAHLGIAATRLLIRAVDRPHRDAPESALALAPIVGVCQDRATWRAAFRFVGIHSSALPELWHRLAHDWPQHFHCALDGAVEASP